MTDEKIFSLEDISDIGNHGRAVYIDGYVGGMKVIGGNVVIVVGFTDTVEGDRVATDKFIEWKGKAFHL